MKGKLMKGIFLLFFTIFITMTNPILACPREEDATNAIRTGRVEKDIKFHSNGKLWKITTLTLRAIPKTLFYPY